MEAKMHISRSEMPRKKKAAGKKKAGWKKEANKSALNTLAACVEVFNDDGSSKMIVLEEGLSSADACYLLVNKNHFKESPNWALIERLGDIGLGEYRV